MLIDFCSSLYLGMQHSSADLPSWDSLTTGVPALLGELKINRQIAQQVAALQGMETGILASSSLHLMFDFFQAIDRNTVLFLDEQAYPLMDWASRIATGRGIKVLSFASNDLHKLSLLLQMYVRPGHTPFILCDGWNPVIGKVAPLRRYLELLRPFNGYLLIDDTQCLGVLGENASKTKPLGEGGGGTLRHAGISSPAVVSITSLAKGLGVPLAVMSGSYRFIRPFMQHGLSRIHCSQVAHPVAMAAIQALKFNQSQGNQQRAYLSYLIEMFRREVASAGLECSGGIFPVQSIKLATVDHTLGLYHFLQKKGVSALLLKGEGGGQNPIISFCINTTQHPTQFRYLGQCLLQFQSRIGSYFPRFAQSYNHDH